jgi:hypothetical protein
MNDETLILYYYDDGLTGKEREEIASRLATDPDVAKRYQALCRELDGADLSASIRPSRDMVHRWHDAIDRAADRSPVTPRNPGIHLGSFFWGAVVTGALAIGIGIGAFISGGGGPMPAEELVAGTPPSNSSSAFMRGLQVHLRDTGQELSALPTSNMEDRSSLILKIIGQNRLFERSAEINNADDIARLLRAFDLVLVQLATEDISPEESAALQSKLLFELNVVLTKIAGDTSNESQTI